MKLRHIISTIAIASLPFVSTKAENPVKRFSFGLEWGIAESMWGRYDYQYRTLENFRAGKTYDTFESHLNGMVLGFAGVNLSRRMNLGIYSGYQGLTNKVRIVPVELKVKYFTGREPGVRGWLLTAGGGVGLNTSGEMDICANLAEAGFGRRIYVGCGVSMDITLTFLAGKSHPPVFNNYDDIMVDTDHLEKSDKISLSGALKISLNL